MLFPLLIHSPSLLSFRLGLLFISLRFSLTSLLLVFNSVFFFIIHKFSSYKLPNHFFPFGVFIQSRKATAHTSVQPNTNVNPFIVLLFSLSLSSCCVISQIYSKPLHAPQDLVHKTYHVLRQLLRTILRRLVRRYQQIAVFVL